MKSYAACLILVFFFFSCKKSGTEDTPVQDAPALSNNTIIVGQQVPGGQLVQVDSNRLVFTISPETEKIATGTILASDRSTLAPNGFLRKVLSVSTVNGDKVFVTEQAAITDAVINGKANFSRRFTDADIIGVDSSGVDISALQRPQNLSFHFTYHKVLHDADGNLSTTQDQVVIDGEMDLAPTFDFDLDISWREVKKFSAVLKVQNTHKITAESKIVLASLHEEVVLQTFELQPFTIFVAGLPVPIAKQWIAIVLGADGNVTARVTAGAQNVTTVTSGIIYENSSWNTIQSVQNAFTFQPPSFQGTARVEPWLQIRYEIRPYAVPASRIYIGARGSVIGEATANASGLATALKWGVKLSAKAQMQIWNRTVLDYDHVFFENEYPIATSQTSIAPTVNTGTTSAITQTTLQISGDVASDGGSPVTARGFCWSTTPVPTTTNSTTTNGTGTGSFSATITGLLAGTTYYLRAYATNSVGTSYGQTATITTLAAPGLPTVSTTAVSAITTTGATTGGTINADGGATVTARGVCWSTSSAPVVSGTHSSDGTGTGTFSSTLSGLSPNTTYYVRAYATNTVGTTYGNERSFTTAAPVANTVTDIDGNVYNTIVIGSQVWMKENLRVTHYSNGDPIPHVTDFTVWNGLTTGAYMDRNNDPSNADPYGRNYNFYIVQDARNVCPAGWHVPSDNEWATMEAFVGIPTSELFVNGERGTSVNAGGKLKATTLWASPNQGASNTFGFTAVPFSSDNQGNYYSVMRTADGSSSGTYTHSFFSSSTGVDREFQAANGTAQIRCLKN